uniref:Reverse transcriptase Ty1/copia-type domain-containing protein n=1 Tax=Solanum lycopersicum TaxID=4081 RepID=A0A3Q7J8D3_SOLLC
MLIAAKKKYDIQKLKGLLSAEFEMKDLGAARKILGMEIIRDRERRKLFLSQRSYIQKVLARFGMSSSKPIDTPSAANIHLTAMFAPQSEEEKEYMSRVPYASAVGSLMYAMVCTRPDLAHAVSVVSRFMGQPGREHWQAVKRIFRYLRGTSDVGLIYGGDTQCLVTGYSDSDYAGDVDTRRSMTGYVFTLGGSVVSWKATLQPTVTLSTTEAEYMALTEAAKEGIWLKGLGYTDVDMADDLDKRKSTIGYLITFSRGSISWQSKFQKCVALFTTEVGYIAETEADNEMKRTAHRSDTNAHELRVRACHIFDSEACHDLTKNCCLSVCCLGQVWCGQKCYLGRVIDVVLCLCHGVHCVCLDVRHHAAQPCKVQCGLPELSSQRGPIWIPWKDLVLLHSTSPIFD